MTGEQHELHAAAEEILADEREHQSWHVGFDVGVEAGMLHQIGHQARDLANSIHMVHAHSENNVIADDPLPPLAWALAQGITVILHQDNNEHWQEDFRGLIGQLRDVADRLEFALKEDEDNDD